jgi:hypothetical protein
MLGQTNNPEAMLIPPGASEDPRLGALTASEIINVENWGQQQDSRKKVKDLKEQITNVLRGNDDKIPDNALTEDARLISMIDGIVIRFGECQGFSASAPQPIEYHSGVSDDVMELFCHGMPMPPPKETRAQFDDLLIHLSQIFGLHRKASFVYVLQSSHILDRALAHVSPESDDYERFERAINTARCLLSEVSSQPSSALGMILTEAHMLGIDQAKVDEFILNQQRGEKPPRNEDMGKLPEMIDSDEGDKTLYIEHDNGQLSLDLL